MKKKANKKPKKIYDENGNWADERSRLISGLRKVFRLHPIMQEVIKEARVELPPKELKGGKEGKRVQVRFRCASCGNLFSSKNYQIDHVEPMVPLDVEGKTMTLDETWERLRCKKENLQLLCSTKKADLPEGQSSCHTKKSSRENFIREEFHNMKMNPTASVYNNLKDLSSQEKIAFFSKVYDNYVVHKEEERLAKEQRKLDRLAKKKSK